MYHCKAGLQLAAWFSPLRGVASDETRRLDVALSGATEESAFLRTERVFNPHFTVRVSFFRSLSCELVP